MAYQKQNFITYFQEVEKRFSGEAYCNGLDNIEKYLLVDVDEEYIKDGCASITRRLQELKAHPEQIGKKENTVRAFMTQLNKYLAFRRWQEEQAAAPSVAPLPTAKAQDFISSSPAEDDVFFRNNRMSVTLEGCIHKYNSLEDFEKDFPEEFLNDDNRVGTYLEEIMWKYEKDYATVSKAAGLDRSYVGNIIRGKKNNPGRDALIAICLAAGTTFDEVKYLLKYAGHAPLYVRNRRDVIIWFGFMKKKSIKDVDSDLYERGYKTLTKPE